MNFDELTFNGDIKQFARDVFTSCQQLMTSYEDFDCLHTFNSNLWVVAADMWCINPKTLHFAMSADWEKNNQQTMLAFLQQVRRSGYHVLMNFAASQRQCFDNPLVPGRNANEWLTCRFCWAVAFMLTVDDFIKAPTLSYAR